MGQERQESWKGIAELFHSSVRAPSERKIGVEIERIGAWDDGSTMHYRDRTLPTGFVRPGARTLLNKLADNQPGWSPVRSSAGEPLGFVTPLGKVSLEPGSQLELSTQPADTLHSVKANVDAFDSILFPITEPLGLHWIGLGLNPCESVTDVDLIASPRYDIMTEYLGQRGKLGTSMMRLTTSVQINLDYTSEEEGIEMLRASLAVAPISYALFGNSPIGKGKPNGFLSFRQEIWTDTDKDRTGFIPEAFGKNFNFNDYAKLIWHQPLMFAQDHKREYVPGLGKSLEDISRGALPNVCADEWNQLNAVREYFTEARLKPGYVEVRSIDGLGARDRYASIAFWVGLLYSSEARKKTLQLLGGLSDDERRALAASAAKEGVSAKLNGKSLRELSLILTDTAKTSLEERGHGEEAYLKPIYENLEENTNPGLRILKLYQGEWQHQIAALIQNSAAS